MTTHDDIPPPAYDKIETSKSNVTEKCVALIETVCISLLVIIVYEWNMTRLDTSMQAVLHEIQGLRADVRDARVKLQDLQAHVDHYRQFLPKGCDDQPGSGKVYDQCGICGGNGLSCMDCMGQINGTMTLDICGICGGNGSACSGYDGDERYYPCVVVENGVTTCKMCQIDKYAPILTGQSNVIQSSVINGHGHILTSMNTSCKH